MAHRTRTLRVCIFAAVAAAAAAGCGAGSEGGGGSCPVGSAEGSWLVDEPERSVQVTGAVMTPGEPPGQPPSYEDAELPVRGAEGQLAGAAVTLMDASGMPLSEDVTDCDGRFVLPAPVQQPTVFVHVEPAPDGGGGGYTGYVRARATELSEVDAGELHLLEVDELGRRLEMMGESYDPDTGWIVQSFASTRAEDGGLAGGHGLRVNGTETGQPFAVTGTRTIETDRLPAECAPGEADVPKGEPMRGPDGDIVCYTDLLEMIFVPHVEPAAGVELELLQPPDLTCTQRQPVDRWLVMPGSVSRVRADCS